MKRLIASLFVVLALSACVSKSAARRAAAHALAEGHQRAIAEQQQLQPAVWFRGDVRHQRIPWTEGLTLSQALLSAQYTWNWDPRVITVTRNGEVHAVNPRRLLRGQEDPVLEPGDQVEVRH